MTETNTTVAPQQVIGIGASAGGLDALEKFFDNVPRDSAMAFVVVQHLSPDFKSLMDELLARRTTLPIHLVEDGMPVEAGHVYLIPPKKEMIIAGGVLRLSERDPQAELTLPIDVFFRSLAQDCGPRAAAVVLSGGGSDGSRGIRDVYTAGGLVIVQEAATAQFDGMPKSARDTGVAHWVLAPEQMPAVLLDHASHPVKLTSLGAGEVASPAHSAIYRMLMQEYGIDFTHYKPSTITRRIERRLLLAHTPNLEEYSERLHRDREELDVLYRDLLIGVTRFFRDPEAFEVLEHRVLPELLRRGSRNVPIRLWVAGCATGEEPYSLAILCHELMAKMGIERPLKVFATDVHRDSIERASRAMYDEEAVANVTPERLARYFSRSGRMYQVVPDIRQLVVFAQHDVLKDAPFTRVDFISCRNLLIYFQPNAQQRVLSLFHFALNRGGVMFLGPSESAGPIASEFEVVDKHWRAYRKTSEARAVVEPPRANVEPRLLATPPRHPLGKLLTTYDALLEELMPPSLLVTESGELVHAFGGASSFLRAHDGRASLDVLDLVDTELKLVLAGGLKRASASPAAVVFKGVRVGEESHKITVRRVRAQHMLITFDAMAPAPVKQQAETEIDLRDVSGAQLAALEAELGHTKENLQAAIEELQASNEELQASNEELQAANEELQSTNEELQSVNEELYTVNAEYQRKIGELTELTNDMDNLLSSTEVGTVFLDQTLRIRKFTPQIAETFNLLPHDVGRSIETFAHKLSYPALVDELKRVVATGGSIERELRDVQGRSYFLRLLPYRAKGRIDGVVLTLIEVSSLRAAEDALFHERYLLNSLLLSVPDAIYFKDARGRFIRMNAGMATRLGLSDPRDAVGRTVFELRTDTERGQDVALDLHRHDEEVMSTGELQAYKLEKRTTAGGETEWDLVTRLPLRDTVDRIVGIIVIYRNVTDQKRAEAKTEEAVRRRDQFLAMLSHELRNPLGAVVTATGLLRSGSPSAQKNPGRLLDVLERQSQQMARLLDDLLEASRVTQNKIELRKTIVDLRAVIRDTVEALRSQVDARAINLKVTLSEEPLHVLGDPARLQQIHANLLNNAAKYTPRGGNIVIEAGRVDGHATVSVRDDGVGIPREMLDSVFDLFVQSNRTLERAAGGLGLGLTLVRSLVDMHGGEVTAKSGGVGKGSELTVRMPLATEVPPVDLAPTRARPRVPDGASVVIVEDGVDSREMLCEALEHAGYTCHTTGNGLAALELIDRVNPDVAILDVGLPGIDGFEIARRVRANPAHAHVCLIALTGYGQAADRITSREAGFDEHLVKPARAETLFALIGEMRLADGRSTPVAAKPQEGATQICEG